MRFGGTETNLRVIGRKLGAQFVLWNTAALSLVMLIAAFVLYNGVKRVAEEQRIDTISRAVRLTRAHPPVDVSGSVPESHAETGVEHLTVTYGASKDVGTLYRFRTGQAPAPDDFQLLVPQLEDLGGRMRGLIVLVLLAVVAVGALVALVAANQISRPIRQLVEDVRQISRGNLAYRTRVAHKGEVGLLARSIDLMTRELETAQQAGVELSVRERELDLASDVREALLPLATPLLPGYDLGAVRLSSANLGGDFHDFVERPDGCVGLLVCDVSGQGVPAALVGATARSYLRSELERTEDVAAAFQRVNRWLAGDVRRGMFVTALYALIEPQAARARVVCAGHKLPLLRYAAQDGTQRLVHPEGIALGFDKGPVFDRRLEVADVPLEPGDRLLLANSAPVAMTNAAGRELGEKAFYGRVLKHAPLTTTPFLKALRADLEQFAGETIQADVSLVTAARPVAEALERRVVSAALARA